MRLQLCACARVCRRVNVYYYIFFLFLSCQKNLNKEMEMIMFRCLCNPRARAHGEFKTMSPLARAAEVFGGCSLCSSEASLIPRAVIR